MTTASELFGPGAIPLDALGPLLLQKRPDLVGEQKATGRRIEFAAIPADFKVDRTKRTIAGWAARYGNVDLGGDQIMPGAARKTSLIIFGVTLVLVYTVSTLYHTIPWGEEWKDLMLRVDNSMILIFIAGTHTPMAMIVFDGWLTWAVLGGAWGIAAVGVAQLFFFPQPTTGLSVALAGIQGWLGVLLVVPLVQRVGIAAVLVALLGGLLYTLGMIIVVTRRPRLWPHVFSYHEVFHLLAVGASAAHFVVTMHWIRPFAAV